MLYASARLRPTNPLSSRANQITILYQLYSDYSRIIIISPFIIHSQIRHTISLSYRTIMNLKSSSLFRKVLYLKNFLSLVAYNHYSHCSHCSHAAMQPWRPLSHYSHCSHVAMKTWRHLSLCSHAAMQPLQPLQSLQSLQPCSHEDMETSQSLQSCRHAAIAAIAVIAATAAM